MSRIEIRDALPRFARGPDRRDLEPARSAFHDDAQVVHGVGIGGGDPRHDVVESQQAHVLEHTLTRLGQDRHLTSVGGRYTERYERRAGVWRIATSHAVRDRDSAQAVGSRFPGRESAPRGCRDGDDPSYLEESGAGIFRRPS